MVLTRLNHKQIFDQEVQRLFRIELDPAELFEPYIKSIVYRPLFTSIMEEQFMNTWAKEQIKTLVKFGGSMNEDVVKWLQDVEEVFDRAQLQPANKFLTVQSYLIDAAAKWFRFNKTNIGNWSTFKSALITAYQPSFHETLLKLEQRHQLPAESIMEYYCDKMHLCSQVDLNMSSSMILHYLTKGLNDSLLPHVIRRHPATPNEFLTIAQDEEKIQFTLNGLSLASTSSPDNYLTDDIPIDHMVTVVKRPTMTNTRSSHSPQPLMNLSFTPPQSSSSSPRYYHQHSPSSSKSSQCYECYRFGHIARYCPNRKNV